MWEDQEMSQEKNEKTVWPMMEERKKELIKYCYPEIYKRLYPDETC